MDGAPDAGARPGACVPGFEGRKPDVQMPRRDAGCRRVHRGRHRAGAQTKELTLWTHWAAEQIKRQYVEEAIADFEKKNPGIKIKASWYEKNALYAALKTALRAGQAPDIFYAEPDQSRVLREQLPARPLEPQLGEHRAMGEAGLELQGQALRPAARSLDGRALLQQEADGRARREGAGEPAALGRRLPRHGEEGQGERHRADVARQRRPAVHRRASDARGAAAKARARRLRQAADAASCRGPIRASSTR